MYLAEHEIGEGETNERCNATVIGRKGLTGEVVSPYASFVHRVHAARLHIASKLEHVLSSHPREGVAKDEIVWSVAVVIRRPDVRLEYAVHTSTVIVHKVDGGKVA